MEDRAHEGGEVVGAAGGDDIAVDDAFLVDPLASGIHHVVDDGHVAGAAFAAEGVGGAEHPGAVADGGHRDFLRGGIADELDHAAVAAHVVRRGSTRNHDEVVVGGFDAGGGFFGFLGVAMLADVGFTGLGADHIDGVAGFLEAEARVLEFEVFVDLFDEDCDFGHVGVHP